MALCEIILNSSAANTSYFEVTACYNKTLPRNINKPRVVDVTIGSVVHLWCHYCDSNGNYYPKWWFYKPRGEENQKDLLREILMRDLSDKVSITPTHKLNIYDFNLNNSGIYTCKCSSILKKDNVFLYILEGIIEVDVASKVGTSSQWHEYKKAYLFPINKKLKESKEEPFRSIRNVFNKTFKLATVWDNWSECKENDHQKGVRKRLGRCRLQPNEIRKNYDYNFGVSTSVKTAKSMLSDGYDIACRSLELNNTVPKLSEITRNIPEFEEEEACNFTKGTAKHKVTKSKNKNKTMKQVEENGHVTLTCTDANPNSELKWFKDTKLLNSLFRNKKCKNEEESSHISVDTNNSLHILHITKKEEGNYSCQSDDKKVQEFEIKVVSKSKLLNQEFIRYSIYLGFVLSLAMACYCAGVCIAFHRRTSFVDPLSKNRKGYEHHRFHCERESLLK
ncbi:uncharacterized protein LOC111358397 [Spodoptera litura]|uniref:Uncharacterized protein LOC111358397 n=1 Tax=Spodoptera litura TaxID=69820 RepID=A0A9J7EKB3_SPOLT|nr:uncharacterized protein LOC111358397 [Spodoptera litura]